jgi:hypothetical protein
LVVREILAVNTITESIVGLLEFTIGRTEISREVTGKITTEPFGDQSRRCGSRST